MNNHRNSGFIGSEWAIAGIVCALLVSILLRFANLWIKSNFVASVAYIIASVPVVLIVVLLLLSLIIRRFIDRRIAANSPATVFETELTIDNAYSHESGQ